MNDIVSRTAIIGVGGAGCNVVSDIFWDSPEFDTIAVSTNKKVISNIDADRKLLICKAVTKGMGTDGDIKLGRKCAQTHIEEIKSALTNYDVVFIIAGMGGGTGSGAAPVIAEIAQGLNKIVFSILINPFSFESGRLDNAIEGVARMKAVCPMTTVVENDKMLHIMPNSTMEVALHAVNVSISKFIIKQNAKVTKSVKNQLNDIGQFMNENEPLPTNDTIDNLVTN